MARQIGYGARWNDEDWPEENRRRRSSRTGRYTSGEFRSEKRGHSGERMGDDDEYEENGYEGRSRGRGNKRSENSRGESRGRRDSGRDGYD